MLTFQCILRQQIVSQTGETVKSLMENSQVLLVSKLTAQHAEFVHINPQADSCIGKTAANTIF